MLRRRSATPALTALRGTKCDDVTRAISRASVVFPLLDRTTTSEQDSSGLETWRQLALSFPVLSVFMFLINVGPFNQPILRSVFYGLFEGGVLTGLTAVATATERGKRTR